MKKIYWTHPAPPNCICLGKAAYSSNKKKKKHIKKYWPSLLHIYCSLITEWENLLSKMPWAGFSWRAVILRKSWLRYDFLRWRPGLSASQWTNINDFSALVAARGKGILLFEAVDSTLSWKGGGCCPKTLGLQ